MARFLARFRGLWSRFAALILKGNLCADSPSHASGALTPTSAPGTLPGPRRGQDTKPADQSSSPLAQPGPRLSWSVGGMND